MSEIDEIVGWMEVDTECMNTGLLLLWNWLGSFSLTYFFSDNISEYEKVKQIRNIF